MSRWLIALDLILTLLYLAGWVLALMGLGWVGLAPCGGVWCAETAERPSCPCWR
jgi:hypothetical protein